MNEHFLRATGFSFRAPNGPTKTGWNHSWKRRRLLAAAIGRVLTADPDSRVRLRLGTRRWHTANSLYEWGIGYRYTLRGYKETLRL